MNACIAIAIWNDQVSTTADFARRVLLVNTQYGRETDRRELEWDHPSPERKAVVLRNAGAGVLLCGAVSRPLAWALAGNGVTVVPFVSGPVEAVLEAYLDRRLAEGTYLLPGCAPGARRRWRRGYGGAGRGRGVGGGRRN